MQYHSSVVYFSLVIDILLNKFKTLKDHGINVDTIT